MFVLFLDIFDILKEAPDKHDLLNLLADIDDRWYEIGLSLKVGDNILNGLESEKRKNVIKLNEILQSWMTTKSSPVTWDTVITAMKGPLVNNVQKAEDIIEYLTKGK